MNRFARSVRGGIFCCSFFLLAAPQVFAHGTHVWFTSPADNDAVDGKVAFEVKAPHAENRYIHLRVTRVGDREPTLEGLVPLKEKKYTAMIDVTDWKEGQYEARAILLGAIHQHPVRTRFFVGPSAEKKAAEAKKRSENFLQFLSRRKAGGGPTDR